MKELSNTERENIDWLYSVLSDNTGKYTSIFKEYALKNIEKFERT